jgi:hypothetical protein
LLKYNRDPMGEDPVLAILSRMVAAHIVGGDHILGCDVRTKSDAWQTLRAAIQEALASVYGHQMTDWADAINVSLATAYKWRDEMQDRRVSVSRLKVIVAGAIAGRTGTHDALSRIALRAVRETIWGPSDRVDAPLVFQLEEQVTNIVKDLTSDAEQRDGQIIVPQNIDLSKQDISTEARCRMYGNIFVRALRDRAEGNRRAMFRGEFSFQSREDVPAFQDDLFEFTGLLGALREQGDRETIRRFKNELEQAVERNRAAEGEEDVRGQCPARHVVDAVGGIVPRTKETEVANA